MSPSGPPSSPKSDFSIARPITLVRTPKSAKPTIIVDPAKKRPSNVCGTLTPDPVDVSVTTANQRPSKAFGAEEFDSTSPSANHINVPDITIAVKSAMR